MIGVHHRILDVEPLVLITVMTLTVQILMTKFTMEIFQPISISTTAILQKIPIMAVFRTAARRIKVL